MTSCIRTAPVLLLALLAASCRQAEPVPAPGYEGT
jgi:hypothetical protein